MATAHVQGAVGSTASGTTFGITLPGAPTRGNLVCVGIRGAPTVFTGLTVVDGNGNVYTKSPNSPSPTAFSSAIWLFWWRAASTPSATITITWTGGASSAEAWADEFSYAGNCKIDTDASATGGPGTTANTPTLTPTFAGSLMYSCMAVSTAITAPVAGGTLGAWTGAGGAITNGNMAEYILSQAASNRAVQYTLTSGSWTGMIMAFMIDQPGHIQLEGGTGNIELEAATGDIALET